MLCPNSSREYRILPNNTCLPTCARRNALTTTLSNSKWEHYYRKKTFAKQHLKNVNKLFVAQIFWSSPIEFLSFTNVSSFLFDRCHDIAQTQRPRESLDWECMCLRIRLAPQACVSTHSSSPKKEKENLIKKRKIYILACGAWPANYWKSVFYLFWKLDRNCRVLQVLGPGKITFDIDQGPLV